MNFTDYFLAANGQTYFATSKEYIPNTLNVYRNGIKLIANNDVDISSGQFFVLVSSARLNDQIVATGPSANSYSAEETQNETFFSRLGFDFDKNKFGNALTVSGLADSFYKNNPVKISDWQQNLLKGKSYGNFFKNPVGISCNEIKGQLITIRNAMCEIVAANANSIFHPGSTIPSGKANANELSQCTTIANSAISTLNIFKSHTDRISGVTVSTTEDPDYEKAISLGTTIARYANAIDGVKDFSPILGSFTSLFIDNDLRTLVITIDRMTTIAGESMGPNSWANTNYYDPSKLIFTSQDAKNYSNTVNSISEYISTRVNHDKNYYKNCLNVMTDQNKINQLVSIPNPAAIVLVRDYIGTEELKKLL